MGRKKKAPYVAPVGERPPPWKEEEETRVEWLAGCLRLLQTWIPWEHEPETMGWSDPGESIRHEREEKCEVEQAHSPEARRAFEVLLEKWEWPETEPEACFLMRTRLEWAEKLVRVMAALPPLPSGSKPLQLPDIPGRELIRWLCFDLYDACPRVPKQWWDSSSFEEHYRFF